jgi:hypothetical protein
VFPGHVTVLRIGFEGRSADEISHLRWINPDGSIWPSLHWLVELLTDRWMMVSHFTNRKPILTSISSFGWTALNWVVTITIEHPCSKTVEPKLPQSLTHPTNITPV